MNRDDMLARIDLERAVGLMRMRLTHTQYDLAIAEQNETVRMLRRRLDWISEALSEIELAI